MPVVQEAATSLSLEQDFQDLASQWKRETSHLSRLDKIVVHPAYLKIIGMGQAALPLILRELDGHVDYWFTALESIARTSPIQPGESPSVNEMAAQWIEWGKRHGYC